jgi:1-acyl-sn-glycerol-3-phosphate acyltransferase
MQNVFVFWLRYRVEGLEKLPEKGGALLLANHQSYIDPLLVAAGMRRPVSYLARHNLFQVPVIGWILRNTYVMPIRRESAGADSIRESVRRLEHGYYVGMFPEGTRTRDGRLGEMKPGFVALVRRTRVPVVPVGIAGAFEAFPKGSFWMRPRTVRVVFGVPFSVEEVSALTAKGQEQVFVEELTRRIQSCVDRAEDWRRESP